MWLVAFLGLVLLSALPAKSHENGYLCHHYYYDEHGFMVIVPVFHDLDHPHAIQGVSLVHVPVVHHTHDTHTPHEYKHKSGGKHHRGHGYMRHFYREH